MVPHGFLKLTTAGGSVFYLHHAAIERIDPPGATTKYTAIRERSGERTTVQESVSEILTTVEEIKNRESA